jgi:hypothetical protein
VSGLQTRAVVVELQPHYRNATRIIANEAMTMTPQTANL